MNGMHSRADGGARCDAFNIRPDAAPRMRFQLDHGGARIILVDPDFQCVIAEALTLLQGPKPFCRRSDDAGFGAPAKHRRSNRGGAAQGYPGFAQRLPGANGTPFALSYT